ncbi:MAG TPA: alpha/beta fold hydrolase [Aequorivita sp.]|nr:alpha/beta fold hydrolase [Aequorivita sp.]
MKLHSQILGKGNPFIILHGFFGMSDNWKTLGTHFSELGYEVHLLDQRNHGRSFHSDEFSYKLLAQDLKEYCAEHNLNEVVLLGHSMGGKVAMQFAVDNPQVVSKLIVADIAPKAYPPHHHDILKALSSLDFSKIQTRQGAEDQLSEYIEEEGIRLFLLKNLFRKDKNEFGLRLNLPVLTEKVNEVGVALPKNTVFEGNTLFLAGERSGYIQSMDEILIKKHFPEAIIKTISGAGHWLHAENPEEFYDNVKNFL